MKSKINWVSLFLEFLVVLVGILLAFQLNQCSDRNKSRQLVDQHLEALYEECAFNKRMVELAVDSLGDTLNKAEQLLGLIQSKGDPALIDKQTVSLMGSATLYLKDNAYNTLIQSGDIRYVEDFDKKNEIINLYEYFKWAKELDKLHMNSLEKDFYPYINENFDLLNEEIQAKEVYHSKKFANTIGTNYYYLQMRNQKYGECLQKIDRYLKKMK